MSADILRILVVLLGIAVVAVVLIQQPKEGGMGAFSGGGGGSGASSTVFGAKGSGSFLFRLTAGVTLAFAIAIIALVKVTNSDLGGRVLSTTTSEQSQTLPSTDDIPNALPNTDSESAIPRTGEQLPGAETIPGTGSNK